MTDLVSVRDLHERCDVIVGESMRLIVSSSDVVSVLILPSVNDNPIAVATAALLSDTFCRWLSPYIGRLDESQLWPISVPLALVLFKTMPFGEYIDDRPLDQVYNQLIRGMAIPEMGDNSTDSEAVVIKEQTICWFEHDLEPKGLRQIGEIWYEGGASTGSASQISFSPNDSLKQLKLHEKAVLDYTFDRHVITFTPSNRMPILLAKYDWIDPEVPISAYQLCIDSIRTDGASVRTIMEVTFSRFVQNVEFVLELEQDAIMERSEAEIRVRRINDKIKEFVWPCGNVVTNGAIRKQMIWGSKRGQPLQKDIFVEIRCATDSALRLSEGSENVPNLKSRNQNLYRLKFRTRDHDVKQRLS